MNLAAYFARIGYDGPLVATRAVLADLMLHHTRSIPFENLDAFVGRRVSLDPVDVERKLVHDRRGGWCFEQNLLFGNALRELGFDVIDLSGRVVWGRAADVVAPRTHRVLRVQVDGGDWLADVGFGGMTLTGVLDLHAAGAQSTPHGSFRLRQLGAEHLLEALVQGAWLPMFRFDLAPQLPIDFEAANFQLVHDPASLFTQGLRVARVADDGRHALRDLELAFYPTAGEPRREQLADPDAVLRVLRENFGLDTNAVPQLRTRLAQLFQLNQIGSAAKS
jgi:N-hydroxyarylamine O-acetyltransferase